MKELLSALPDDRPVTSLCVVEDVSRCPAGYVVVARTYDQDLDADLWKDGFFGKRVTRYLCLSKNEGDSNKVIDSICIINEKDSVPNGFTLLSKTIGTDQKACRKRQVCYRLSDRNSVFLAVTDVIILSKTKVAPDGFTLAGEMNGLLICYKTAPLPSAASTRSGASNPASPNMLPNNSNSSLVQNFSRQASSSSLNVSGNSTPKAPVRPAPLPPKTSQGQGLKGQLTSAGTLSGFTGLEGVPFVLGPRVQTTPNRKSQGTELFKVKNAQEIFSEYFYPFTAEREAAHRPF